MRVLTVVVRSAFSMTNAYFYADETTGRSFLIDPGAEGDKLLRIAREMGWTIEKILLTHGHFDHIGGIEAIRKHLSSPVLIHEEGEKYLSNPEMNLSRRCGTEITIRGARYFRDGERFILSAGHSLKVIHTPGHSQDSVVFYDEAEDVAFVGDTIFRGSIGESCYPGGNAKLLMESIKRKILTLPERTILCSGHSGPTTVGDEIYVAERKIKHLTT